MFVLGEGSVRMEDRSVVFGEVSLDWNDRSKDSASSSCGS